jgi:hypothetical protein
MLFSGSQSIGKTTKVAVVGENAHLACPGTVDKKQVCNIVDLLYINGII